MSNARSSNDRTPKFTIKENTMNNKNNYEIEVEGPVISLAIYNWELKNDLENVEERDCGENKLKEELNSILTKYLDKFYSKIQEWKKHIEKDLDKAYKDVYSEHELVEPSGCKITAYASQDRLHFWFNTKVSYTYEGKRQTATRSFLTFNITKMFGCCGIAILSGMLVPKEFRGHGIAKISYGLKEELAKALGFSLLICTDVADNKSQNHVLELNGWNAVVEGFVNKRTGNKVNIWTKPLV